MAPKKEEKKSKKPGISTAKTNGKVTEGAKTAKAAVKETKVKAKQAEKAGKAKEAKRAEKSNRKRGGDLADKKVKLLVKENPKRGKSAERFAIYKTGMKVSEFVEKGGLLADVKYDLGKKFISLS